MCSDSEAADSHEAFVEQAKLTAHEAWKDVLLGDDAAADADDTFLDKPSLKHATWRRCDGEHIMSQTQGT